MIISVEDLKKQVTCGTDTDGVITAKLDAIEAVIRVYTNNNFQKRKIRFTGSSTGNKVFGSSNFITVGDTVQLSDAFGANDGLYVVTAVAEDHIELDKDLASVDCMVTKVEYPPDVVQCAVDLYRWKQNMGEKVGIKSETISRHSVTYEDSGTLFMGYPLGILNSLNLHKKARC
jgi:hypothetical protein